MTSRTNGDDAEEDDPVGEHQPVASFGERAGRKRSSATKLARNGKPLKLVLPPV